MRNQTSSVQEILNNTNVTSGLNKTKPPVTQVTNGIDNDLQNTISSVGDKYKLTEQLYTDCQDLVDPQFKAWYCKRFHAIGKDRVLVLASQARVDGLNPRKLFSHLLKGAA